MSYHGLFIGINYAGTGNALAGCINDATNWAAKFRSVLSSSTVLTEEDATKASIVRHTLAVLDKLSADDTAIIQFSGHGTQITDRNSDESDRKDEALVPYDLRNSLLSDDELRVLLSRRAAGSRVLLITDCCHSGTMTRSLVRSDMPRFLPFGHITQGMDGAAIAGLKRRSRTFAGDAARGDASPDDIVHFSGCQDNEFSYDAELGGQACGAFSYFALDALSRLPKGMATYATWHKLIRDKLPWRGRYDQTPELTAENGKAWFVPGFEPDQPAPPVTQPGADQPRGSVRMLEDGVEWRATRWERMK